MKLTLIKILILYIEKIDKTFLSTGSAKAKLMTAPTIGKKKTVSTWLLIAFLVSC